MGTFSWPVEIQGLDGGPMLRIEAMVDTGATFTVIPGYRLSEIGISPSRRAKFEYGDGRPVDLHIAEARATIDGESASPKSFSVRMILSLCWGHILCTACF